jgi:hypothetical protein
MVRSCSRTRESSGWHLRQRPDFSRSLLRAAVKRFVAAYHRSPVCSFYAGGCAAANSSSLSESDCAERAIEHSRRAATHTGSRNQKAALPRPFPPSLVSVRVAVFPLAGCGAPCPHPGDRHLMRISAIRMRGSLPSFVLAEDATPFCLTPDFPCPPGLVRRLDDVGRKNALAEAALKKTFQRDLPCLGSVLIVEAGPWRPSEDQFAWG